MNQSNPAWLDRMYNNRVRVPDHGAYFERWANQSARARAALPCKIDIPYGSGAAEMLDIFHAAGPQVKTEEGAPVVVFIHGGYWRSLDKSDHSFLAPALTAAGACVVIPNYALCPAVTIPQITMQMVAALAWTCRTIGKYGGDADRITVIGHSAGGHLAAMMVACLWRRYAADLPRRLVKNALSISGLYDLEPVRRTGFLADLRLTPEHVAQASPCLLPPPPDGTLVSVAGGDESEEFLRQNRLIQAAWGAKVVPVCESLPGLNHFSVLDALCEPGHRLRRLAFGLLGPDRVDRS